MFVEGSPRSGTTWLNTLLGTHPEIAGASTELHLFEKGVGRLFDNYEEWGVWETGFAPVMARTELVDAARDFCDSVLMRMREKSKPGATYVLEKTPVVPPARVALARKAECFPDAWHIHIVRDGRDVAASLMRAPWQEDRTPEACIRQWLEAVAAIRDILGAGPRYREISYEQLRADPAAVCAELFEWLGLPADDGILGLVRGVASEPVAVFEDGTGVGRRAYFKEALRQRAATATSWARRTGEAAQDGLPRARRRGQPLVTAFANAVRRRDAAELASLTTDDFELEFRSGDGDLRERGDAARATLLEVAEPVLGHGVLADQRWSTATGLPYHTAALSIRRADGKRIDIVFLVVPRGRRVRRVVLLSAGSPAGRPLRHYGEPEPVSA